MERTEKEKLVTYISSKKDILPTVEFLLFLSGLAINERLVGSGTFIAELDVLCLSVEYAAREVSRPSFTVKTPLLSRATKQVSIGNIVFY